MKLLPHSRRYRLVGKGYSICLVFLKLFEKVYAPLTAGLLAPFRGDPVLAKEKRCQLDRLIGIGAAVTRRPLPHHRAYGSVHGGSRRLR